MEGEGSCVKFLILIQDEKALLQLRREQRAIYTGRKKLLWALVRTQSSYTPVEWCECHHIRHLNSLTPDVGTCGGLNEMAAIDSIMFECLVPSWWNCFGRIDRCDLADGSMSLWVGLESVKPLSLLICSLCFMPVIQDVSSQLPAPVSMPIYCCHVFKP